MFELFPDQPVYEYPQLINISYSFVWAFLLASVLAIVHRVTFTGDGYPKNFFQSLILGAVITTMIMMAIGDSLARGLGVFGAMAIIRFRTRIDDPRDVLFLFAALSTGLAIGVYGFTVSFVGTMLFSVTAFLLHYSPFKIYSHSNHLFFTLGEGGNLEKVMEVINAYCNDFRVISITVNKDNALRYEYSVALKKDISKEEFIGALRLLEGVKQLKIARNEITVG